MAKQTINQGTAPTGASGDTFRSGSAKLQANDDELYNYLGDGVNLNKLGTAAFKNTGTQAGNVMEVGAFNIGQGSIFNQPGSELVDVGGFRAYASSITGLESVLTGITIPWASDGVGGNIHAIACVATSANPDWYTLRWGNDKNAMGTAKKIRTEANTAVDSNGFIKAASPIIKLFSNKIELNEEAQQQEIIFEKLSIGDYLIRGTTGFALEGWYVETPKDANGNVLFSVIYDTLENGDISVKTYKKKFDFETASIVADLENPVDITVGRWIDIRLQELPQPEFVPPVSNTPASFQPTGISQAVSEMMNGTEQ